MTQAQQYPWKGESRRVYQYEIYSIWHEFPAVAGNYIYAKELVPGSGCWSPIYIGQTANLSERFDDHNKMQCILAHSTRIHVHENGDERLRLAEENDIIENYNPPCNG